MKTAEADLYCILYVSSASRHLSDRELEHLVEKAQKRNLEEKVTGVLLHCDGSFMQYIEGPKKGVLKAYEFIQKDTKHKGILELIHEKISEREFPDWSLASKTEFLQVFSNPDLYPNVLRSACGIKSPVCEILYAFWNGAR